MTQPERLHEQSYRNLSFWHDSLPDSLVPRASLEQDTHVDVVIIGAGYTGMWTAYYLNRHRPDLDIAILESEVAGFGASGRNGGWCSAFLSNIERWLEQPEYRESALRLQRQMFETVREVGEVARQEAIDCHYQLAGGLEVAVNPAQLLRLEAELKHAYSLGFDETDYQGLSAAEARERLNIDGALGGLLYHHVAAIHPCRLARGLAATLEMKGVRIYERSPVSAIEGRVVHTPVAKVTAAKVVQATEGYSSRLAGLKRRLIPMHSMMVATEPLSPAQLRDINFNRSYAFGNLDHVVTYGQITADHRIAFGCRGMYRFASGIQRQFDAASNDLEFVRETLLRFFPSLRGIEFTHAWGGSMGVSRSLSPSVNFDADSGQAWAGGFFGNGVGATHLAGKTLADLLLGRDTELTHTPWVNPPEARRNWEPEPLRWLGINSMSRLLHQVDRAEYKTGRTPAVRNWILKQLVS